MRSTCRLHPAWQRRVVGSLRAAFSNCQFVVSTHSPLVFPQRGADQRRRAARQLQVPRARLADEQRQQRDPRGGDGCLRAPQKVARAFDEARALLNAGLLAEARTLGLDELGRSVTEHDTEWIRLSTELDVLERIDAPHHERA